MVLDVFMLLDFQGAFTSIAELLDVLLLKETTPLGMTAPFRSCSIGTVSGLFDQPLDVKEVYVD